MDPPVPHVPVVARAVDATVVAGPPSTGMRRRSSPAKKAISLPSGEKNGEIPLAVSSSRCACPSSADHIQRLETPPELAVKAIRRPSGETAMGDSLGRPRHEHSGRERHREAQRRGGRGAAGQEERRGNAGPGESQQARRQRPPGGRPSRRRLGRRAPEALLDEAQASRHVVGALPARVGVLGEALADEGGERGRHSGHRFPQVGRLGAEDGGRDLGPGGGGERAPARRAPRRGRSRGRRCRCARPPAGPAPAPGRGRATSPRACPRGSAAGPRWRGSR